MGSVASLRLNFSSAAAIMLDSPRRRLLLCGLGGLVAGWTLMQCACIAAMSDGDGAIASLALKLYLAHEFEAPAAISGCGRSSRHANPTDAPAAGYAVSRGNGAICPRRVVSNAFLPVLDSTFKQPLRLHAMANRKDDGHDSTESLVVPAEYQKAKKLSWAGRFYDVLDISDREERRLMYKLDAVLVTFMSCGYFLKYL